MKKLILGFTITILSLAFIPNQINASNCPVKTEVPNDSIPLKSTMLNRLDEIKKMDKSSMSRDEKKALRKEVRVLDKSLHDNYGGIYISVGALIIIILLIIIFL